MSKFEELCKAYATSINNFSKYRDDCKEFASNLREGMSAYFQCPIEFTSLLEEQTQPLHTLTGLMYLGDDTFWHIGIKITLYKEPKGGLPQDTALLSILIKKIDDDYFIVKLGNIKQKFTIHNDKEDEFIDFYEFIFEQIKRHYEEGLKDFLEQNETSIKIGFQI